jgi:hypothetical protein
MNKAAPLLIIMFLFVQWTFGQNTNKKRKDFTDHFSEIYHVLKNEKSVKDGPYELSYKGHPIIQGQFQHSEPTGMWRYFNSRGELEYEYDFSSNRVILWNPSTKRDAIRWESGEMKTGPFKSESYHVIPYVELPAKNYIIMRERDTVESTLDIPPLCLNSNLVFQFTLFDILRNSISSFPKMSFSLISFTVDENGNSKNYEIEGSTGNNFESQFIKELEQKNISWTPAIKDGKPTTVKIQIPIIMKTFNDDPNWNWLKIIFTEIAFMDAKRTANLNRLPTWNYKLFETPYELNVRENR